MILGALFGWLAPSAAVAIKPLGTVFINMMFCIVVPLVFASISGAVANMKSRKRAGKIMGTTIATFVVTGAIAAVIMFLLVQLFPPVLTPWTELQAEEMGEYATISDMIVNFFTTSDFVGLLTPCDAADRVLDSFGFAVNLNGGSETLVAKFWRLTNVMLKFVKIVTYYAASRSLPSSQTSSQATARKLRKLTAEHCCCIIRCALCISLRRSRCLPGSAAARAR
ncbi:MAG: dicarboxylate/amino acid:cation symporter [Oscillospiraceae bacterium]